MRNTNCFSVLAQIGDKDRPIKNQTVSTFLCTTDFTWMFKDPYVPFCLRKMTSLDLYLIFRIKI